MLNQYDISGNLAIDVQSIDKLKLAAKTDSREGIRLAAQQFESLFVSMLLKSMRDASPKGGLLDSQQADMFTGLLDQQMAQKMTAGKGLGLAEMLVRQLTQGYASPAATQNAVSNSPLTRNLVQQSSAVPSATELAPGWASSPFKAGDVPAQGTPKEFVNRIWPQAAQAGEALGVPPQFLVAHAALESGWGQREIQGLDGRKSFNLFGIKAGPNWKGDVVEAVTTEYVNGVATKSIERFRAYDSYAQGFSDYLGLLKNNPRYAAAFENGADATTFATGLQKGGYATDPLYASKLVRILNSQTMRSSLIGQA
jgi:flagellar protein FlgJ